MKGQFWYWLLVGAISTAWLGCGGSTTNSPQGGGIDASSITPATIGTMFGGDGGVAPTVNVTQQVADGCSALCNKEATAMCPNQGSVDSCAAGCRLILSNPKCEMAANALIACSMTSTVSCDAQGKASLDSCAAQGLAAAACFISNANDPTLQGPCATVCSKEAALHCPNDNLSGCQVGCQISGGFVPACDSNYRAYIQCGASSTMWMCDQSGKSSPGASCFVPALSFVACALTNLSQDAGGGGG